MMSRPREMEGAQLLGRLLSGRAAAEDDERPRVRRRGGPSVRRDRRGQRVDDVVALDRDPAGRQRIEAGGSSRRPVLTSKRA